MVVGQITKKQKIERTYGRKTFRRLDIMAERHSVEKKKSRKKNDRKANRRQTQDRTEIWSKRRLTENCRTNIKTEEIMTTRYISFHTTCVMHYET